MKGNDSFGLINDLGRVEIRNKEEKECGFPLT